MINDTITAVYENGILRPTVPLALPEHSRVQIQVRQILAPEALTAHRRRLREALIAAGLSLPIKPPPSASPLPAGRRAELARAFSGGRPLSELILEEREGR